VSRAGQCGEKAPLCRGLQNAGVPLAVRIGWRETAKARILDAAKVESPSRLMVIRRCFAPPRVISMPGAVSVDGEGPLALAFGHLNCNFALVWAHGEDFVSGEICSAVRETWTAISWLELTVLELSMFGKRSTGGRFDAGRGAALESRPLGRCQSRPFAGRGVRSAVLSGSAGRCLLGLLRGSLLNSLRLLLFVFGPRRSSSATACACSACAGASGVDLSELTGRFGSGISLAGLKRPVLQGSVGRKH